MKAKRGVTVLGLLALVGCATATNEEQNLSTAKIRDLVTGKRVDYVGWDDPPFRQTVAINSLIAASVVISSTQGHEFNARFSNIT